MNEKNGLEAQTPETLCSDNRIKTNVQFLHHYYCLISVYYAKDAKFFLLFYLKSGDIDTNTGSQSIDNKRKKNKAKHTESKSK